MKITKKDLKVRAELQEVIKKYPEYKMILFKESTKVEDLFKIYEY